MYRYCKNPSNMKLHFFLINNNWSTEVSQGSVFYQKTLTYVLHDAVTAEKYIQANRVDFGGLFSCPYLEDIHDHVMDNPPPLGLSSYEGGYV